MCGDKKSIKKVIESLPSIEEPYFSPLNSDFDKVVKLNNEQWQSIKTAVDLIKRAYCIENV